MIKKDIFIFMLIFVMVVLPGKSQGEVNFLNLGSDKNIADEYLKLLATFKSKLCGRGEYEKYQKLFQHYNKMGPYLPLIEDHLIDISAMRKIILLLKKKLDWLEESRRYLKKGKANPELILHKVQIIKNMIDSIQADKWNRDWENSENAVMRLMIDNIIVGKTEKLFAEYEQLLLEIPFYLNFEFPVDYLTMRKNYDEIKDIKDKKDLANSIYVKRKVLEDGFDNKDKTIRTLTSTLLIRMKQWPFIFLEDIRYDLEYWLKQIQESVKNIKYLKLKFKNWQEKTQKLYDYYQKIMLKIEKENHEVPSLDDILTQQVNARFDLINFTFKKIEEVYDFWDKQKEWATMLFVFETILLHEVGRLDGEDSEERNSIIRVIWNRSQNKKYYNINNDDFFFKDLKKKYPERVFKNKWLNLLLREGEFSFTYFFIPSSVHLYCPNFTGHAASLRKENLGLVLNFFKNKTLDSPLLFRYFSRVSMVGRIDMGLLWSDYAAVAESPGPKLLNQNLREVQELFNKDLFRYLYSFYDDSDRFYYVLQGKEFGKKSGVKVVLPKEGLVREFFHYRDPQVFKFFKEKE